MKEQKVKTTGVDLAACYKQLNHDMAPFLVGGQYLNVCEAKRVAAICLSGEWQEIWEFTFNIDVA